MPVLFSYAFRPFFLLASIYAIIVVPYWTAAWLGYLSVPLSLGTPAWWHAHEMLHGFAGAAIAGFALTAVATWTRRPPVAGPRLMILSALWIIARVLFALPSSSLRVAAMLADLAFEVLLFVLMSREIIAARNTRNYKVLLILGLLPITDGFFFAGVIRSAAWSHSALMASLWLIVLLVNLIAGRIVPAFTKNWLKLNTEAAKQSRIRLPPAFDRFDLLVTWLMIGFAALHLVGLSPWWTATWGVITAGMLLVRLFRWQGFRTTQEPLVSVLHLAFAWLAIGFFLLGLARVDLVPRSAGVHAFTSGAITTMIMAVASRAALGHTNRPLRSHPTLVAAYVLITISAVFRVTATWIPGARAPLVISASAWCLGFMFFAWRYAPILALLPPRNPGSLPTVE